MIIVVKNTSDEGQVANLIDWVKDLGLDVHLSRGEHSTVIGLIGDTSKVDIDLISSLDVVASRIKRNANYAVAEFIRLANGNISAALQCILQNLRP